MAEPTPDQPAARGAAAVGASVEVRALPAVVFEILADPRQHPRIAGSRRSGGSPRGRGRLRAEGDSFATRTTVLGLPRTIRCTVVELDEGRRIAWRRGAGHRARYRVQPLRGSGPDGPLTRVTEELDPTSLPARLLLRVPGATARHRARTIRTLTHLRQAAESDAGC